MYILGPALILAQVKGVPRIGGRTNHIGVPRIGGPKDRGS